ncbi:MAG: hypothetical protein KDI74_07860, partial [Gammaproteobacteria bacterium]|nr:hypothetical protein [Gammaproteobacteria bacterium]
MSASQREKFSRQSRLTLLQMEQQINDMLAFSRGGKYEPQPVDLNRLMHEMLQMLDPVVEEQGINLRYSGVPALKPAMVTGNHSALLGAVMNIALNAKQHCARGGIITI